MPDIRPPNTTEHNGIAPIHLDEKQRLSNDAETKTEQYPTKKVLFPILFSICMASFLVSLDRTIVGVAVPAISNEFKAFSDISWYESAYLLTFATLQLPMGKIYTFFSSKWIYIFFVFIFEIGSIISAAAPSSVVFIIGRAVSGIGCAGVTAGSQVLFVDLLPLEKRPKYQGLLGATFGLAAIAGPLLGGAFASGATWRWCFWLNLPIGGIALVILLILLPVKAPPRQMVRGSLIESISQFDPIGTLLLVPGIILLLLALQWGPENGSWSSPRVLGTIIPGIFLLVIFAVSQIWIGENGTIPPRIISQRSIAAASAASLGFGSALIIITFYLPIWYQAIQGLSAVDAGIRLLAYFLSTVFFVIGSGALVSKLGYYTPLMILGTAIMIVGCGLLSTVRVNSPDAEVVGFQVLFGVGMGLALIQPINAGQTVLSREDIPTGLTVINFMNFVGGTVFVGVCQSILTHTLTDELRRNVPDLDVASILRNGATSLSGSVTPEQRPLFINAYNAGLVNVFYCAMALSAFAFIASCFLEWRTVKARQSDIEASTTP
ncbi:major facilitator superfamily domain-containing protein [Stachybotrys elegans]|uniref:Major facilitator superfamily domain-containing protein n=1 Tax=Stachybotrys elegans TaxID=80388 RepID=A0A8K0SJD6_9HYPO|nr:major facilitator superfamily domain-containing protein [Stachybotrys elegans]